jgi:hypothetical protein
MPTDANIKDPRPFVGGVFTGTAAVNAITGQVTVNGAGTATTKSYPMESMGQVEFSLLIGNSGMTGSTSGDWTIMASNDYDGTDPVRFPGTWHDVTALQAGAGGNPPFVSKPPHITNSVSDTGFTGWTVPFGAIRFVYANTVSTISIDSQFIAKGF